MTAPHPGTTRAHILATLTVRGHGTAPELAGILDLPLPHVSSALYRLVLDGLASRRWEGGAFRYWVGAEPPPAEEPPPQEVQPDPPTTPVPARRSKRNPPPLEVVLLAEIAREPGSTTLDLGEVVPLSGPKIGAGLSNLRRWGVVEMRGSGWFVAEPGGEVARK